MRAIDTNVLVRLLTRDNIRQAAIAETFIEEGAWVSVLELAETIWVLANNYGASSEEQIRLIELLLVKQDLVIQDSDATAFALELFRAKPSLGFSDCLILEYARKSGNLPLDTFDRNLAKMEGAQRL